MVEMTPEAKRLQAEYKREWQRKNKEKNKEAQARYWNRKAAALEKEKYGREIS